MRAASASRRRSSSRRGSPSGSTASRSSMRRRSSTGSPSSSARRKRLSSALRPASPPMAAASASRCARALVIAGALVQLAGARQRLGARGACAAPAQRRRQPLGGERRVAPALRVSDTGAPGRPTAPRRTARRRRAPARPPARSCAAPRRRRGACPRAARQLDVQPRALDGVGGQRQLAIALLGGERPLAARLGHLAQRPRRLAQVGIAGDRLFVGAIGVEVALELVSGTAARAAAPGARARADRR